MGWENMFGYMFSSLFTHHKVVKGYIFTTALQKDKSNAAFFLLIKQKRTKTVYSKNGFIWII